MADMTPEAALWAALRDALPYLDAAASRSEAVSDRAMRPHEIADVFRNVLATRNTVVTAPFPEWTVGWFVGQFMRAGFYSKAGDAQTYVRGVLADFTKALDMYGNSPVPALPVEAYNPIPLDLTDPRLAYLLDPTADVDEDDVVWEREYREKEGRLDGCTRCQNGLHWQCHGCSCPCSTAAPWVKYSSDSETYAAWVASVRAIGPWPDRGR